MTSWWRWPLHLGQVLTGAKDFRGNPVLGSKRLNRWGLHRERARWAQALGDTRRWLMSPWVDAPDREACRQQGYVRLDDFLSESDWQQLRQELAELRMHAIEMCQPPATTRRFNLDDAICAQLPVLRGLIRNRRLLWVLRYAAGYWGTPIAAIQVIHTDAAQAQGSHDPQTEWHTDTFHSTAKAWFFVHPVRAHEGPFGYVPGSHRRTPQRLQWEYEQSQLAARHPNVLHAKGSFRLTPEDLTRLGYPEAVLGTTRGNTLVVADTSGVHRRTPSQQASVRVEVYFSLRRNPFWAGLYPSLLGLPLIRRHWAGWALSGYRWLLKMGRPGWIPAREPGLRPEELARVQQGAVPEDA